MAAIELELGPGYETAALQTGSGFQETDRARNSRLTSQSGEGDFGSRALGLTGLNSSDSHAERLGAECASRRLAEHASIFGDASGNRAPPPAAGSTSIWSEAQA